MQPHKLVSVVMPAFNAAETVRAAVQSVFEQTYTNLEILIVDDASTDNTLAVLEQIAASDARVRVIALRSNGGAAEARNAGMRAARGELIAFLDADDLWLPHKLEVQVPLFADEQTLIVGSWYDSVTAAGKLTGQVRFASSLSLEDVLNGIVIGCLTAVFRTRGLQGRLAFRPLSERANGPLGHRLRWRPIQEDYLFWIELLTLNPGCGLRNAQCSTARYTLSADSASSNKAKAAYFHWMILRHDLKVALPRAVRYFIAYALRAVLKHSSYRWGNAARTVPARDMNETR